MREPRMVDSKGGGLVVGLGVQTTHGVLDRQLRGAPQRRYVADSDRSANEKACRNRGVGDGGGGGGGWSAGWGEEVNINKTTREFFSGAWTRGRETVSEGVTSMYTTSGLIVGLTSAMPRRTLRQRLYSL